MYYCVYGTIKYCLMMRDILCARSIGSGGPNYAANMLYLRSAKVTIKKGILYSDKALLYV